jgi:IgA Peptidase M64
VTAPPLRWKDDQGADIHLLRTGPESRRLVDGLDIDSGQSSLVNFVPQIQGNVTDHGIELQADVGIIKALSHPNPDFPRVNNFLITAVFDDSAGHTDETEIRIHVHDAVKEIWLTPPALSVHQGSDECRFTVLARFNDESVGDITDWSGLTFQSGDESVVKVLNTGVLQAVAGTGSAPITAALTLSSPATNVTSGPANSLANPSWADVAQAAKVEFIAGGVLPDMDDPESIKTAVEGSTNVLFIAEGFRDDQRFDYRNIVNTIARVMRGDEAAFAPVFQPFGILKRSINYWTVFIPSQQDGISSLGEYVVATLSRLIGAMVLPQSKPPPSATEWKFLETIHEVGMPIQADATRTIPTLVHDWQQIFGPHVTEDRVKATVQLNWKTLAFHSPLNERDTAFGICHGMRPSASMEFVNLVDLLRSTRRASRASVQTFISGLTVGTFPIGTRWKDGGPDAGLVCMICLCDHEGGLEKGSESFFLASTGNQRQRLNLAKSTAAGYDVVTNPVSTTRRHLMASTVAHELGHALKLGDEYGDGAGKSLSDGSDTNPVSPNLQAKVVIAPPPTGTDPIKYDSSQIRWLWPRITAAGVMTDVLTAANIGATDISVPLRPGHNKKFAANDVVRFKEWPDLLAGHFDLFVNQLFRVSALDGDALKLLPVTATAGSNDVSDVSMADFNSGALLPLFGSGQNFLVIRPNRVAGVENKLVADPIQKQIDDSNGPLNAPAGSPTAACVASPDSGSVMTPTNLPALTKMPRTKADIIGIYEGGSVLDCGVFRPAGRCRMRDSDTTTNPFCHVCRFLVVEGVDPTAHGDLDKLYPEVSP